MAFKTFADTNILTASDVNTYLMKQSLIVCTSTTRPATPNEGMAIYETDLNTFRLYSGAAWGNVLTIGAWAAYSPTILSLNAGTDWAIGNAVVTGQYAKIGRMVVGNAQIIMGNTTTYGTKALGISSPLPVKYTTTTNAVEGIARYNDVSAGSPYVGGIGYHASDYFALFSQSVSATYALFDGVTSSVPFTWAVNDTISINFFYETSA